MMKIHNREMEVGIYIGDASGVHTTINRRPYSTPFSNKKYEVVCWTTKDKAAIGFEIEIGDKRTDTIKIEPLKTGSTESDLHRHQIEVLPVGSAVVIRPDKESMPAFTASCGDLDLSNLFVISSRKISIGGKVTVWFGPDGDLSASKRG